ncbi:hypothetical protein C8R46DRAFT_1038361 [Mycena filopes]|nr:hypothetical protein C8R46DRAFT_1038361 [Mycena filopes]
MASFFLNQFLIAYQTLFSLLSVFHRHFYPSLTPRRDWLSTFLRPSKHRKTTSKPICLKTNRDPTDSRVSGGNFGPKFWLDLASSARHLCPPGLTPKLCPTFKTPETSFQATCLEANVTRRDSYRAAIGREFRSKVPQIKSLERTEFVGSSLTRGGGLWSSFCCQFKLRGNYGKKFLGLATAPSAGYSSSKCSGFNSLKCLGFNNYFNGFDLKWVRCALVFKPDARAIALRCGVDQNSSGADKLSRCGVWKVKPWFYGFGGLVHGTDSMSVSKPSIFNQAQLHAVFSVSKGHILSNSRRPSVETRSFHSRCILHLPWILANDWNPRCRGKGTNVSPEGTMAANSTNGGHALSRVNGKRLELGKREESGRGGNPSKDKGAGEQESQPSTRLGSREELWLGASPARKRGSQQNIAAENSTSSSLVEDNKIWLNSWLVQNRGAAELHCGVGNLSKGNRIYLQLLLQAVGIIKWGTGTKIRYNGDAHAYCATVELAQ